MSTTSAALKAEAIIEACQISIAQMLRGDPILNSSKLYRTRSLLALAEASVTVGTKLVLVSIDDIGLLGDIE